MGFGLSPDMDAAATSAGEAMLALMRELFPLCRSITGPGLRATVERLGRVVPLAVTEVPSGTRVFDWTVPPEWSVTGAYLEDADGNRIVDFSENNLHVLGYSTAVDVTLSLDDLRPHLHTLPAYPDRIPFCSSYYRPDWGFCLQDSVARSLAGGPYHAVIDSRIEPGSLTLAEHVHRGRVDDEILVFAHTCHPSLCNDNLSGIVVAAQLAAFLRDRETHFTYRFVFAPATIGSIAWLALNESRLGRIRHGLVLAMLGDRLPLRYKASRAGNYPVDKAARHVLHTEFPGGGEVPYSPWGFDERQFATLGINLPVGRLTRALPGELPEEHTSADNFDLMSADSLGESWLACLRIMDVLERDRRFVNLQPKGEPQLGRRGLYKSTGGYYESVPQRQMAMLWLLDQSDGQATLLDIAVRADLPFDLVARTAAELIAAGLLAPAGVR